MSQAFQSSFEPFAGAFVRQYWETIKSGHFAMPPNDPVKETVEELLSEISHETGSTPGLVTYTLRMNSTHGDWWLFTFTNLKGEWELVGASARSDTDVPHDLLGPVYSGHFGPFLRQVTKLANETRTT